MLCLIQKLMINFITGIFDDRRLSVESPTIVNISPSLHISIESVSCGINHTIALTSVGVRLLQ